MAEHWSLDANRQEGRDGDTMVSTDTASVLFIQFARTPVEGQVKTRMLPHLTATEACRLHSELTLWTCRRLLECNLGAVEISVAGDTGHAVFEQCQAMGIARLSQQKGKDLGERMYNAIAERLAMYTNVILVGSDCPGIDAAYLEQAVMALQSAPIVLGPATDGGYVLIGARDVNEAMFRAIPWGGDQVYAKTCDALTQLGCHWEALPRLADIDRPEDLPAWEALKRDSKTCR